MATGWWGQEAKSPGSLIEPGLNVPNQAAPFNRRQNRYAIPTETRRFSNDSLVEDG
jgi:hypothetical protein